MRWKWDKTYRQAKPSQSPHVLYYIVDIQMLNLEDETILFNHYQVARQDMFMSRNHLVNRGGMEIAGRNAVFHVYQKMCCVHHAYLARHVVIALCNKIYKSDRPESRLALWHRIDPKR